MPTHSLILLQCWGNPKPEQSRSPEPSIANRPHAEAFPVTQDLGPSWMDPYIRYLRDGELPDDRREAAKIRQKAGKYILIEGQFRRTSPQVPSPRPSRVGYGRKTRRGITREEGLWRIKLYLKGTFGHICRQMPEGMSANVISASDTRRYSPASEWIATSDFEPVAICYAGDGHSGTSSQSNRRSGILTGSHRLFH